MCVVRQRFLLLLLLLCVGVFWGPLFRQRRRYPTNYPQRTERRSTLPLPVIVGNGISSLGSLLGSLLPAIAIAKIIVVVRREW